MASQQLLNGVNMKMPTTLTIRQYEARLPIASRISPHVSFTKDFHYEIASTMQNTRPSTQDFRGQTIFVLRSRSFPWKRRYSTRSLMAWPTSYQPARCQSDWKWNKGPKCRSVATIAVTNHTLSERHHTIMHRKHKTRARLRKLAGARCLYSHLGISTSPSEELLR